MNTRTTGDNTKALGGNGSNVYQWTYGANNNQKWLFDKTYNDFFEKNFTTSEDYHALDEKSVSNTTYDTIGWNFQYEGWYSAAMLTAQVGQLLQSTDAARLLRCFLYPTGNAQTINFYNMNMGNYKANANMVWDMNAAMQAAEYYLSNKSSTVFTSIKEKEWRNLTYGSKALDLTNNWYLAVNEYRTWTKGSAAKSANTITMTMTYNMRDFYNWDANGTAEVGFVSPSQMNTLHRAGMGRDFHVSGQMQMRIVWTTGQRIGSGATWSVL